MVAAAKNSDFRPQNENDFWDFRHGDENIRCQDENIRRQDENPKIHFRSEDENLNFSSWRQKNWDFRRDNQNIRIFVGPTKNSDLRCVGFRSQVQ